MKTISRKELPISDLYVDAMYEGRRNGNAGDDPLPDLVGVSNSGGFRYLGSKENPRLIVLITNMSDLEWPDDLDDETGVFTYYGDNKEIGQDIHNTPRHGNELLRDMFNNLHLGKRNSIPPILVFEKARKYRDVIFKGLAIPGVIGLSQKEDLIGIWKSSKDGRFQNYQAKFTIMDISTLTRKWLDKLKEENSDWISEAPKEWQKWRQTGSVRPLKALRSMEIRTKEEQLPSEDDVQFLRDIYNNFEHDRYAFEDCAVEIVRLFLGENVVELTRTRPSRDGGRDAIGKYLIGYKQSSIQVEFSVEAKCYDPSKSSVGVKELARLISRLRHRQFGILITTSWVNSQAYKEIKEDNHPIIIVSGGDIVTILKTKEGISSKEGLIIWLRKFEGQSG